MTFDKYTMSDKVSLSWVFIYIYIPLIVNRKNQLQKRIFKNQYFHCNYILYKSIFHAMPDLKENMISKISI